MALTKTNTQQTTKKTRTHIIKLFTKNVIIEKPKMILYKLGIDKIWIPKSNLWTNTFLTDYFILPVYENDSYEYRVYNENDDKNFSTVKIKDVVEEVLAAKEDYAEYAVIEKSTNK